MLCILHFMSRVLSSHGAQCYPAEDGRTVVMQAAAKGDISLLRHILDNTNQHMVYVHQSDLDGWNALFYAVQGKRAHAFLPCRLCHRCRPLAPIYNPSVNSLPVL